MTRRFKRLLYIAAATVAVIYFSERAISYINGMAGDNARLHTELVGQVEKYKQITEYVAELEKRYVGQEQMREELLKQFAIDKDALDGRIKVLSNATFLIREKARQSGTSDIVYQGATLKYVVNEIRFAGNGPPVGYVLIFDDGRVVSKIYNHTIDVKTAVARDEDSGKYSVLSRADYVLKSPSINSNGERVWTNVPYPLKIVGGTALIDPTEKNQLVPHLMLWAPHFNGGISGGVSAAGSSIRTTLDFSVAGYGVTRNDLDWKFAHLGFDIDSKLEDPGFHLTPFSYRFWPAILTNSYIGPSIGMSGRGLNGQLNLNLTF